MGRMRTRASEAASRPGRRRSAGRGPTARLAGIAILIAAGVWAACASKDAAPTEPIGGRATRSEAAAPEPRDATASVEVPAAPADPAATAPRRIADELLPSWPPKPAGEPSRSGKAEDASRPGRVVAERPTLTCLGARWYVAGDANRNARIEVRYRASDAAGDGEWRRGLDLFRSGPGWTKHTAPARDEALYAGSVFYLDEGTSYEMKLTLVDPDGGGTERVLKMKTRAEPKLAAPLPRRTLHVVPGTVGGSGSKADPLRGLAAADAAARPGDLLLVHAGTYPAPWKITKSGRPDAPIVWRGAGDGDAVIDGGHHAKPPERGISMSGIRDVWLEDLAVRSAVFAVVNHEGQRTVMRRCRISESSYGFTAHRHSAEKPSVDILIIDCDLRGPSSWPRSKGIEGARGVQLSGLGHVVCHNYIQGYADAIDTFQSYENSAIDFYRNEIETMTDDGIECDYSCHNIRCFENRLTNVFQGISTQPTFAGPIYVFRNAMYNVGMEPFKMHNGPSGALLFHNTSVKIDFPSILYGGKAVTNFVSRNNIFIGGPTKDGKPARYGFEITSPMVECDYDYDGFGGIWNTFMKWNEVRYKKMEDLRKGPAYRHAVALSPERVFARGEMRPKQTEDRMAIKDNDLRLAEDSKAVDAGVRIFGINDEFVGDGPDLGAYEVGGTMPHYGPRAGAQTRP